MLSKQLGTCAILLCGIGIHSGLVAQTTGNSPQRVEQKRTDLSGAAGMEVVVSTAEYKTGETLDFHLHHGIEAAYVIQGTTVQFPGKAPVLLTTGSSMLNLRDIRHGGFKVVGETSLKLFTVHVTDKGRPLYDAANGPKE